MSIGTARLFPNTDGSGGKHCFVTTFDVDTTNPACVTVAALVGESAPARFAATYVYTGDGALCEVFTAVGGVADGLQFGALTQVLPDGDLTVNIQDVRSYCPSHPDPSPATPSGLGTGVGHRIGMAGDDPPGSGTLDCG